MHASMYARMQVDMNIFFIVPYNRAHACARVSAHIYIYIYIYICMHV